MINVLKKLFIEKLKLFVFRYTVFGKPKYNLKIEPIQVTQLVNEIEKLKLVKASILEVGVAQGITTRFLAEHISSQKIEENNQYFALDTFSSFTNSDTNYEIKNRGKNKYEIKGFEYNDFKTWKKNFQNYNFIHPIKMDCKKFDYNSIAPIKITLLDVDFYVPTKIALEKIYNVTIPGGVIIVDDVKQGGGLGWCLHSLL
jgi:SAM-dependent methyltransferase